VIHNGDCNREKNKAYTGFFASIANELSNPSSGNSADTLQQTHQPTVQNNTALIIIFVVVGIAVVTLMVYKFGRVSFSSFRA